MLKLKSILCLILSHNSVSFIITSERLSIPVAFSYARSRWAWSRIDSVMINECSWFFRIKFSILWSSLQLYSSLMYYSRLILSVSLPSITTSLNFFIICIPPWTLDMFLAIWKKWQGTSFLTLSIKIFILSQDLPFRSIC